MPPRGLSKKHSSASTVWKGMIFSMFVRSLA
jgi:hypothetical protein